MKKVTHIFPLLAIGAFIASMPMTPVAQDYDDDLYYSPKKAQEKKAFEAAKAEQRKLDQQKLASEYRANWTTVDYPSADGYTTGSSMPLNMDVDTYNRRDVKPGTAVPDSASAMQGDFSYTRRIERYHNPEVVVNSGDNELIEYYYASSQASQPEINVYVVNDPWYSWNRSPWYYGWTRPYLNWTWNFGWGYDPWFDFSWGWGCPWHGPSWGPKPPVNHWASNSPGASRPHGPSYGNGAVNSGNRRPGGIGNNRPGNQRWDYDRPGNMGRPGNNGSIGRPASGQSRPTQSLGTGNSRPSNNSSRGYRSSNSNNTNRSSRSNSSTSRPSTPSYNSGNSGWGSGSYGGGRGHSSGGGSYGGGGGAGGAGRGRR